MPKSLTHSETSYLYVIGHETGPQKIGFSQHPPSRAKALKITGRPHFIAHWWVAVPTETVHEVERFAHWVLRERALGKELFNVTPKEDIDVIENAALLYAAGERVPVKEKLKSERIGVSLSSDILSKIEDWRRHQRPIPSLSAAIRSMVEIAADIDCRSRIEGAANFQNPAE